MMVTNEEIKKAFLSEFHALLRKYNADITVNDHWQGYAECGRDIRMTVEIPSVYQNGECQSQDVEIDLGKFIDKESFGGNG